MNQIEFEELQAVKLIFFIVWIGVLGVIILFLKYYK